MNKDGIVFGGRGEEDGFRGTSFSGSFSAEVSVVSFAFVTKDRVCKAVNVGLT